MKSTILHVRPGLLPERAVIENIKRAYPTVSGFALQHEGELVCEAHTPQQSVDEIIETCTIAKDGHRLFFFGDWSSFEDESDIQPFTVTNSEGQNILALFFEGNFEGYAGLNGKHTNEFVVADEIIYPRLEKAYLDAEGADFDKFIATLKSPAVKTTFSSAFKERGWFAFLPFKGEPYFFGNNTRMKGYDWGTLSNDDGLTVAAAPAPAVVKKLGFLNRKTTATVETPTSTPEPQPVKVPEPQLPATSVPAVAPPATETAAIYTRVKVPPHLSGGVRNAYIRLFNGARSQGLIGGEGELPSDHQSATCEIPVHSSLLPFTKVAVSDTKSLKALREKVLKGVTNVVDFKEDAKSASTVREPATNYTTPTLSESESTRAMEKMIKFLDAGAKKRLSPIELQKMESRWPVFSAKLGVGFDELLIRSVDEIYDLFDKNGIATCAFIEMRRKYIETSGVKLEEISAPGTKDDESKVTKTEEVESPGKKESPGLGFLSRAKKTA